MLYGLFPGRFSIDGVQRQVSLDELLPVGRLGGRCYSFAGSGYSGWIGLVAYLYGPQAGRPGIPGHYTAYHEIFLDDAGYVFV